MKKSYLKFLLYVVIFIVIICGFYSCKTKTDKECSSNYVNSYFTTTSSVFKFYKSGNNIKIYYHDLLYSGDTIISDFKAYNNSVVSFNVKDNSNAIVLLKATLNSNDNDCIKKYNYWSVSKDNVELIRVNL